MTVAAGAVDDREHLTRLGQVRLNCVTRLNRLIRHSWTRELRRSQDDRQRQRATSQPDMHRRPPSQEPQSAADLEPPVLAGLRSGRRLCRKQLELAAGFPPDTVAPVRPCLLYT